MNSMNRFVRAAIPAAVLFGLANQPIQAKPADLDALLQQVKEGQVQSQAINQERERRFLRDRRQQSKLLKEAEAQAKKIERQSDKLKKQFDENEKKIKAAKEDLKKKTGDLGALFSLVRQVSGDVKAVTDDSMISAQLSERAEFLAELSTSRELPAISKLEQLWFTLQQEMTESAKVSTFSTEIVESDGTTRNAKVTRVGVFTATSGDEYLEYVPASGKFQVLARQPGQAERAIAQTLQDTRKGSAEALIDPTRGSVLAVLVDKPTLEERVHQGGFVGYTILGIGALGLLIALFQFLYLLVVGVGIRSQAGRVDDPQTGNALGRVLLAVREEDELDPESMELKLDEVILREVPKLERGLPFIKLLAAIAPLLGLLGTVTGMILTFTAITQFGTSDPKLMAGGISQALITTVLGLVTAIPLLFVHSLIAAQSRSLVRVLDQQSAGLLARKLEGGSAVAAPIIESVDSSTQDAAASAVESSANAPTAESADEPGKQS